MTSLRTKNARADIRVYPEEDQGSVHILLEIADFIETCVLMWGRLIIFILPPNGIFLKYRINLEQQVIVP